MNYKCNRCGLDVWLDPVSCFTPQSHLVMHDTEGDCIRLLLIKLMNYEENKRMEYPMIVME